MSVSMNDSAWAWVRAKDIGVATHCSDADELFCVLRGEALKVRHGGDATVRGVENANVTHKRTWLRRLEDRTSACQVAR